MVSRKKRHQEDDVLEDFEFDENLTILQVKNILEMFHEEGKMVRCPCCDQTVKIYKRLLNAPISRILCLIYDYFNKNPHTEFLHVDNFLKNFKINCRYFSLLKFWGLLEAQVGVREDGSVRLGYWKITDKGKAFVENKIKVPKYFYMYNKECVGFSPEQFSITEALDSGGFSYNEILKSASNVIIKI